MARSPCPRASDLRGSTRWPQPATVAGVVGGVVGLAGAGLADRVRDDDLVGLLDDLRVERVAREDRVDVALLKRLRGLVAQGMSISEAARLVPRLREEIAQTVENPEEVGNELRDLMASIKS